MAGAGWHDFVPGEVLTAANVQDYLQDQTVMKFASAAARTAALPAPSQGMMSFLNDTGVVETYFAAYNASTNPGGKPTAGWYATDRNDGLVNIVPPTTRLSSGGTATANSLGRITFSSTAYIGLDNVFTSAYSDYRIILRITSRSGNTQALFRFTSGGAQTTANLWYYGGAYYATSGSGFMAYTSAQPAVILGTSNAAGIDNLDVSIEFTVNFNDALKNPTLTAMTVDFPNNFGGTSLVAKYNDIVTSFDGFRVAASAGTFGGTIQVYGYNK